MEKITYRLPFLEKCTDEEKSLIEKLKRKTVGDLTPRLLQDETLFYRFLKARDFNLKNAEDMLRKHLSDRKLYDVDNIRKSYTPTELMKTYFPSSFLGFDKEGCFIRYIDGGADLKGMVNIFGFFDMYRYIIQYLEHNFELMEERSKKNGVLQSLHIGIFNMEKSSLFQLTHKKGLDFLIEGTKMYQDNYPERVKALYIINAPKTFNFFFSILKTALASELLKKIHIYGNSGWQDVLLKEIDADVLPAFLGGNRTDPDGNPLCSSFIIHAKPIPTELYKKKSKKSLHQEEGVKKLILSRSSNSTIELNVDSVGTRIEWEFETKDRDIAFSLYYRNGSVEEEIIPKHKVSTEYGPETGVFECEKTGMYLFLFDNTYSWIYSKEIYYTINLKKPAKETLRRTSNQWM